MERQMMPTEDGVAPPWNRTNPSPATTGVVTSLGPSPFPLITRGRKERVWGHGLNCARTEEFEEFLFAASSAALIFYEIVSSKAGLRPVYTKASVYGT